MKLSTRRQGRRQHGRAQPRDAKPHEAFSGAALIADEKFMKTNVRLPAFMNDIIPKLVMDCECRLEEDRDRTTKSISESTSPALSLERAKAEVAEAKTTLRAATEQTILTRRKVNESKSCRHCERESNVLCCS